MREEWLCKTYNRISGHFISKEKDKERGKVNSYVSSLQDKMTQLSEVGRWAWLVWKLWISYEMVEVFLHRFPYDSWVMSLSEGAGRQCHLIRFQDPFISEFCLFFFLQGAREWEILGADGWFIPEISCFGGNSAQNRSRGLFWGTSKLWTESLELRHQTFSWHQQGLI